MCRSRIFIMQCAALLVLSVTLPLLSNRASGLTCDSLENQPSPLFSAPYEATYIKRVVEIGGTDNSSCLNDVRVQDPPPCATLEYALHATTDAENRVAQENITIYVGAGTYKPTNGSALAVINSWNIALIGSGRDRTHFECGAYGDNDSPCSYMNFQIRTSSNVYVRGFTFTRCGPITSAVYIATSNNIIFEDCEFRDNISPPFLVYKTSPFFLNKTNFINNQPEELNDSIATSTCYFSGGVDVFFLDNRTSSGGVSHYSEDEPVEMYLVDCMFLDNQARPDKAVSLPRQSEGYGHGAAVNMRLSNSSKGKVCIKSCLFENNTAEAQAGAVALTIGGMSNGNDIELLGCRFYNNACTLKRCTGGAIGIDFYFDTSFNEIRIKDTEFVGNNAMDGMGGAISLSTSVGIVTDEDGRSDALILEKCLFERNMAFYDGTALGVFSLTHTEQIGLPVNITNCNFLRNSGTRYSSDSTALTAYHVLMTFSGNSSFISNQGGGLSLLGSRVDIMGEVRLDSNVAVFGAGIAMSGRSLLLLYDAALLSFTNNVAVDEGAGIYVEYTSSDFVLAVLNRGCFIQYFTSLIDLPPREWKARIEFVNNTAGIAGAAIYANDMSRCKWLGPNNFTKDFFIFDTPSNYMSPFLLQNNSIRGRSFGIAASLATDASNFTATTEYGDSPIVGFGEKVSFQLYSTDQFGNFRESVWSFNGPEQMQSLGALSSSGALFEYEVPTREELEGDNVSVIVNFSLLGGQASPTTVELQLQGCHPGYRLEQASNQTSQSCVCDLRNRIIVQCDDFNRYFYARDGYWIGVKNKSSLIASTTVPGFLNCTRQGALPGCEIKYDRLEDQCAEGREGTLCGDCQKGYGVTFDLRFCRRCGAGGIVLFVFICLLTVFLALLILFFDFPLPDELKGFVFFAQVIGVIYRNTPYYQEQSSSYQFFDVLINLLGFSLPFQLCPSENLPAIGIALLGFVPPLLATSVALTYICLAKKSKYLSRRSTFNGFHFLYVFVYKYFLDTSFIFISCTLLGDSYVFIYQGTLQCFEFPFFILFSIGFVFLLALGVLLPTYLLYLVYRPGKHVQAADALTHGLKRRRRYRWYGVWDVWRRILFVAANLLISVTTRNIVLLIHCILATLCLGIVCFVKPYKKTHKNISEAIILLCLIGAILPILDDNDMHIGAKAGMAFAILPFIYGVVYILYRFGKTLGNYFWVKGQHSKWERLKSGMQKLNAKCNHLMKSRAVSMVMSFVDTATDRNLNTSCDTTLNKDRSRASSKTLHGQKSYDRSFDGDGEEKEVLRQFSNDAELIPRTTSVSFELREPLLEEEHT